MALIILLSFCLILEVHPQHVSQPQLVVSSTERGSVQLDCKTPYAGVSQCFFYPERDDKNVKLSPSCQLSLTGSELTRWTGRSYSSPEPVSVICYYTVSESGLYKPSPRSLPATVTVLDKKPKIAVRYDSQYEEFTAVCEIPLSGSVRADFRCNLYTGHLLYLKGESKRGNSGKWSCVFTASKTDLLNRLQSVKSRGVSCDYSLNSDPSARSPMSHTYDILNLLPTPAQPSITGEKSAAASLVSSARLITTTDPKTTTETVSPTSAATQTTRHYDDYRSSDVKTSTVRRVTSDNTSVKHPSTETQVHHPESSLLIIVLSVTGTSVLLAGVMIVFPCRFIKKQRTDRLKVNSARGDQGDMMAVLSVEEFGPGAAGTYSVFTSVTAPYQPSGADQTVYTVVIYSLSTQKQKPFSFF
ncbi:uncharacterized protein LOC118799961 [Colossoma macropomum]|uniref:uncharacterized protein LOC118799961 n=1 Tax=Colossoma macropomum TaxID=42526 RepID=UPI0018640E91|nr:uncharacterized protein LOC118799961 [Colossoma macropomum]